MRYIHCMPCTKTTRGNRIGAAAALALAKKHDVPSFNDAAADVTPKENLWKDVHGGFDRVTRAAG